MKFNKKKEDKKMAINKLQNWHTHEIVFEYEIEDENGDMGQFNESVYCSLDDEQIKDCNDELKEMIYGHSSSQHSWDSYTNGVLSCIDENNYKGDRFVDMENLLWCQTIKIDRRLKENKKEIA
jgi:hypothetical protein